MLLGEGGVAPGGGVVGSDYVEFSEGDVGVGEGRVEADGFEKETQGVVGPEGDPVELGEMVVGAGVGGVAGDPGTLFGDLGGGLVVEGGVDHFAAPEGHKKNREKTKTCQPSAGGQAGRPTLPRLHGRP